MPERRRDKIKAMFSGLSSKIGPRSTIFKGLRTSLGLLKEVADASELPVLKGAVGGLLRMLDIIDKMAQNEDDAAELLTYLNCLEKLFKDTQNSKIPQALSNRIEELSQEIIDIVQDIEKMKSQSTKAKFITNDADASTLAGHVRKINLLFSKFQFGSSAALEIEMMDLKQDVKVVTVDVEKIGRDIKRLVQALPRADEARFDMGNRNRCLKGTRVELLDTVFHWTLQSNLTDPDSSASIFWLCGQAGTGKTTISSTVADRCDAEGRLGASFFFSRDRDDRSNMRWVFPTIAYQLGTFWKEFAELVAEVFSNDPDLVRSDPPIQLEKLIINPIKACASFPFGTIILIDALDECKDNEPISTLLSILSTHLHCLPQLKFFITSRPEENIQIGFEPLHDVTKSFTLHSIDTSTVDGDIELYLRKELAIASSIYRRKVEQDWPPAEKIESLVQKSSGLFIFAATAVKFILDRNYRDPKNQLEVILKGLQGVESESSPFYYLDQLYLEVLRQAFPETTPSGRFDSLKMIIGAIVLLRNPLSAGDLGSLLGLGDLEIRDTLSCLHSIVIVPDTNEHPVRLIHPSFFDFAIRRCPDPLFRINPLSYHEQLATFCFKQMKNLKRDLCDLKDASKLNEEIDDLPERIERYIPHALRYACHHWVFHVCRAGEIHSLQTFLNEFCHEKLLYWIEALSLLGPASLQDGIRHIQALQTHFTNHSSLPDELLTVLKDAQVFTTEYFNFISPASLQLYRSALPLSSPSNSLRKLFSRELSGSVRVLRRAQEVHYSGVTVLRGHFRVINTAEFSPDGTLIVSASQGEVRLWDRGTGTLSKTLRLDSSSTTVWAYFFPDGKRIVSVSEAGSVSIWDVTSGANLRTFKLKGGYKEIFPCACSADVMRFVGSSSTDIMIWDVSNGSILNTLRGHENAVRSLAFSQNHMLLASGSDDKTIRLWDAVSGDPLKTLIGHSTSVVSVAFSPSNEHLVSSSPDHDLRLWDISHAVTSKKFEGHFDSVYSTAFSPNGTQIISGSYDGTLRVWNAVDGELLKTLRLGGSQDGVDKVGFSMDGSHYICTWCNAIYIWDAHCASDLDQSADQHLKDIKFSPDGTLLIATMENDVQLWDGLTGDSLKVLNGHSEYIYRPKISSNNQYVAFIAHFQKPAIIYVWDISNPTAPRPLTGHSKFITSIAFSSDSTQIVSSSADKTLRIWSITTGDNIFTIKADHHLAYFSTDGSQIIADTYHHYDIPLDIRCHPVPLNNSVAGQVGYSCPRWTEWVFASRGEKKERCIWLPADWRWYNAVSSRGRVAIGTHYGLVLLDLSNIKLSI